MIIMKITITNTLPGKKQVFHPLQDQQVRLYVCGITPYDYAHIGHARVYIIFDVLYRLLTFLGYKVTYVRNFTDIDDKLLKRAQQEYGDQCCYKKVADRFINAFHQDLQRLGCLRPTYEPRVTDHILQIIDFIEKLIQKGNAYVVDGDVYFSIASYPQYGQLSKQKLDDLRVGARVEANELKKDPLDFALWKSEPEGTFWQSPWGWGRPGWHIECSALSKEYLGDQLDIHAGGMDLIFPHHENERAQSEALTGKTFANYWMHNAFVRINEEKMSKSLGNFFTIDQVLKTYDPMVLRYFILTHYYRAPLDFSTEALDVAQKSYKKLCHFFAEHCATLDNAQIQADKTVQAMLAFLCEDLNTPGMFGVLFDSLPVLKNDQVAFCAVKHFVQEILGLILQPLPEKQVTITPEIQQLLEEREKARAAKNWQRADELRDILLKMGIEVHDKKL